MPAIPPTWLAIAAFYTAVSAASLATYGIDKRRARLGRWRIRERTLHLLDLAGGWPGGLLAQRLFRHKTGDRSFNRVFWAIVALHAVAWAIALQVWT